MIKDVTTVGVNQFSWHCVMTPADVSDVGKHWCVDNIVSWWCGGRELTMVLSC